MFYLKRFVKWLMSLRYQNADNLSRRNGLSRLDCNWGKNPDFKHYLCLVIEFWFSCINFYLQEIQINRISFLISYVVGSCLRPAVMSTLNYMLAKVDASLCRLLTVDYSV